MARIKTENVRKKAGFWGWFFRIILLLLVLTVVTFFVLYFSGFFHGLLRQIIITELSKFTKCEIAIGDLKGDLFTYVDIFDAEIGNQGKLADGKAITVRYARVRWSLWALINGRVKIDSIEAEDGYCMVTQNPGHADLNVAEMFVSPPGPAPMTDIESIRLVRGRADLEIEGVPFKQMDIDETRVEVHSSGRVTRVTMNYLKASLPQLNLPIESFTGSVEYHEKVGSDYVPYMGWTILDKFDMVTPKSHLRMQARLENIPELKGEYNADGSVISLDEFAPILSDIPQLAGMLNVSQLKISIAGSNDYTILGDLYLVNGKIDEYDIESMHANAQLHNTDLEINRLTGRFSGGIITNAFGTVTLDEVPDYDVYIGFESLNLSKLWADLPETVITGEVTLAGKGINAPERELQVNAELLPSTIASVMFDSASLNTYVVGDTVSVNEAYATRGEGTVLAEGTISPDNVDFRLDAQNIALADVSYLGGMPDINGKFSLQGVLSGSFNNLRLTGTITGDDLKYSNYQAGKLLADVDMSITPRLDGRGRIEVESGIVAGVPLSAISADVEFQPNLIELQSVHAVGPDAELQANLTYYPGSRQKLLIHDLAVQYRALRALCPQGFTLMQQSNGWDLSKASFDLVGLWRKTTNKSKIAGLDVEAGSDASFAMGNLIIEGRFSENSPSDVKAVLTDFPFQGIDSILTQSMMLSGKVDSLTFLYFGTFPELSFKLDAMVSNGPIAELPGSGHIALTYDGGVLTVADLDYLAGGGRLTARGSIMLDSTHATPFEPEPLSVNMEGVDLRILQGLTDVVLLQEGKITGAVSIQGDLMHPALLGKIHLENARFLLGELYNYISDFSGDIYFEKDRILFGCANEHTADVQCVSPMTGLMDGKPMSLDGEIQMANLVPSNYDMHLYAGGMNFRSLPGSQFKLAVDVGLKGAVEQLKLSGKIMIVSGLMNIPFGSSDAEQEPELSTGVELPFDMDLALGAERGIWLRNNDADLELAADIRVEYSRGLLSLSGNLDTVRGVYHFIGRDFVIEQGKLNFYGTPTFDPALNIEGVTSIYDETTTSNRMYIYIKVTGTLTHPEITLSTPDHPNLAQNDLIQILALNLSYNEYQALQSSSGQQNIFNVFGQQGSAYLTAYLAGQLSGVVRRITSLDTITLEQTSYNTISPTGDIQQQQQTQVTVGKYLTQNLFLSYTSQIYTPQGLHRLDLEYYLGGGFSLVGMANERARERAAGLSLRYVYRY